MSDGTWVRAFDPIDFTHHRHAFHVEAGERRDWGGFDPESSAEHDIIVTIDDGTPIATGLVAKTGATRDFIVALVMLWFQDRERQT